MANDNLFEVVEELRQIVADLKRTLYGDHATRSTGLITEFDGLRRDVKALEIDLANIKRRRPNVGSWMAAYVLFCAALVFLVAGLINLFVEHDALGIPPAVALWLALGLAAVAAVLFVIGYNWFERP
jgi:hypothetical protein